MVLPFYCRVEYVVTRCAHNAKQRIQTPSLHPIFYGPVVYRFRMLGFHPGESGSIPGRATIFARVTNTKGTVTELKIQRFWWFDSTHGYHFPSEHLMTHLLMTM